MSRLATLLTIALVAVPADAVQAQSSSDRTARAEFAGAEQADRVKSGLEGPSGLFVVDVPLQEAIEELRKTTTATLAFSPTFLSDDQRVTCDCEHLTTLQALERILEGTDLGYEVIGTHIVIEPEVLERSLGGAGAGSVEDRAPPLAVGTLPTLVDGGLGPVESPEFQGTVTGRVTDEQTGQPVASVQVYIAGSDLGTLTQQNGRYLLSNVPAGTHTVTAERLGYRTVTAEVDVVEGQTVVQDFQISEEALQLDELVVTGTPGGTQRRAVGNVVSDVNAEEITGLAPISDMQDLMTGREAGVSFTGADGNVGGGRTINIRGFSSLTMGNQPLIYVDGVRVDNSDQVGPSVQDGRQATRLNDFNPENIASIEVIKGPAAATLYGTEASAGVIQIITKRGETGEPQFDFMIRQGGNWLQNDAWKVGDAYGVDENGDLQSFNIVERQKERGEPLFTMGHTQSYNLSVRGGTESVRYFLSSSYSDETGFVEYNWDRTLSLRSNVEIVPSDTWSLDVSVGYVDGKTRFAQPDRWEVWSSARWSNPLTRGTDLDGFFRSPPEAHRWLSATRDYDRFTASASFEHTPFEWLTHRLNVGLDRAADENVNLIPRHPEGTDWWLGGAGLGEKDVERPVTRNTTLDYAANLNYALNDAVSFTTSFGLQYYGEDRASVSTEAQIFPSPGVTSTSGAARTLGSEDFVENKSLGTYVQQRLNWRDRVFVTGAVRGDDNSAFGTDFDAAIYPKFSATWVVSEESFWAWSDVVNSLRLRSAWGKAGRQPSTFAGVTLYEPKVGPNGESGLVQGLLGNPELGPEVSTELELGFDFGMYEDRISGQVTYYTQTVEDALVSTPVATSIGFPGSQSRNLGEMSNWGWELGLDALIVERPNYALSLGGTFSYNQNRVEDLGGTTQTSWIREGFRFPSAFYRKPVSGEFDEDGRPTNIRCDGGRQVEDGHGLPGGEPVPCAEAPRVYFGPAGRSPKEATMNMALTLFQDLRVRANAEWRGEAFVIGNDILCRFACYPNTESAVLKDDPVLTACGVERTCGTRAADAMFGFNSSFAKLREISATYTLPQSLVEGYGVSNASITLAGRDLWTIYQAQEWVPDERGSSVQDPELREPGDPDASTESGGGAVDSGVYGLPPASSFTATLRVSF